MLSIRPLKGEGPGINDLLNWAALIDSGVVQCKDGSLLAGWFYRGPDLISSTAGERDAISVRVNAALTKISGGWAIWVDAIRRDAAGYSKPEESHFPDQTSRMLDDERRAQFEAEGKHFESDYAIIIQYTPPLRRNSRILDIIYDEDSEEPQSAADKILDKFKKDLAVIEDAIGNALMLRRLRSFTLHDDPIYLDEEEGSEFLSDELVNYLHYCLNNEMIVIKIPESGAYLDTLIGLKDLRTGDRLLYGGEYIAVIRIQGFPEESFPQILGALDQLAITYRWNTRFIFLEQHEAVSQIQKYHRKWRQRARGFITQLFKAQGGTINEDALLMTQQAQSALAVAHSGQAIYGFHTPVVIVQNTDPDILEDEARLVRRAIQELGFAAEIEEFNTTEAWLGSLPGHPIPNVRRPIEHTANLSNLLPLTSIWAGSPVHPNPRYPANSPPLFVAATTGQTPFRCSLHYGELGHVLMFGPPRAGKSTALATFAWSQLRYEGATVCAIEKGRTMKTLCQAVSGLHYEIAGDSSPSFCPLWHIDTPGERAEKADWIATCFELQHQRPPLPEHTDAINRALLLLSDANDRSITHFMATVQNHEVRDAMHYYSIAGTMGHLYDAERDGLSEHHFIVHEVGDLMALKPAASIPAIMHIFSQFRRQLKGQPAMLILDEAATVVFDNDLMTEKLRQALKDLPKLTCQVIIATHSLAEAIHSRLFVVLVESCPYKAFLPNADAGVTGTDAHPGPRDLYLAMGLNPVEIDIVRYSTPRQDIYITCPEGRRLTRLGLGPKALAICGISDPAELRRIEQIQRHYGDEWVDAWVTEKTSPKREFLEAAE